MVRSQLRKDALGDVRPAAEGEVTPAISARWVLARLISATSMSAANSGQSR